MSGFSVLPVCLACGSSDLVLSLDLGAQPLANAFKETADEIQQAYPLAVNLCKKCFHLQLTHGIDPDLMFKHYLYVSGVSQVYKDYLKGFADLAIDKYVADGVEKPTTALDVGCNDGTQLDYFKALGLQTFGVDPAQNIHPISTAKGHDVFCGYFEDFKATRTYDVINAAHVFAHNRDMLTLVGRR